MTTVSVIIPSYNHADYIEECLQSVLDQTYQDFEIIITDDGSTDGTVDKIKKLQDHRIKLFKNEVNRGASVAANHCFRNSSGKYIAMLSSDDVWLPEKLEKQVDYLETHEGIGAVFTRVNWIDKFGNDLSQEYCPYFDVFNAVNRTRFEWLNYFFFHGNALCHPSSLIRRTIIESVGYLNPLFAALPDFDLWIRLCLHSDIFIIDEKLIKFRFFYDKSNASGDTIDGILRNRYENRKILDNYLSITDINNFQLIFPQIDLSSKEIIPGDLKFLLGKLSVESAENFMFLWGLDLIYDYLQDGSNQVRADKIFDFTPIDFIRLTSQKDIHNHQTIIKLSQSQIDNKHENRTKGLTHYQILSSSNPIISLLRKITTKKFVHLLQRSNFFDEEYYLLHNADVNESGINPAEHYLLIGGFEGRDPSPLFDSQWYLDTYKDVRNDRINPLLHYLRFGKKEGRKIKKSDTSQNH